MKSLILLAVCAISSAAKLDRTYLPPASAGSAGSSPGSLQAPSGPGAFSQSRNTNGPTFSGIATSAPTFGAPSAQSFGGSISPQLGFSVQDFRGTTGTSQGSQGFGVANSPPQGFGGVSFPPQRFSGANSQSQGFTSPSPSNQGINGTGNSQRLSGSETPTQEFAQILNGGFKAPSQGLNSANAPSAKYSTSQGFNAGDASYTQSGRAEAGQERSAQILRQDFQNDGYTFGYNFETSNGILAEESGVATNGVQAQGAFSYIGDDGQLYSVAYTADENGYQPSGDHLPTPPPIPDAILRSIDLNKANALGNSIEGVHNEQLNESPQQYNAPSGPASPRKQYEYQHVYQNSAPRPGGFAQKSVRPQYNDLKQHYGTPTQGSPQLNNIPSQQYNPSSQQYKPSSQQYNPSSQQYKPSYQQYNPSSQQYKPSSQQYNPSSQQYKPSSQQYNPSTQQYNGPTQQNNGQQELRGPKQYNPRTSVPSRHDDASQQYGIPQGASEQYNAPQLSSQQYNRNQGTSGQRGAAPSQKYGALAPRVDSHFSMLRQQFSDAPNSYNPPAVDSSPQLRAVTGETFHYNPLATQTFNGNAGAASAGVRPNESPPVAAGFPAARQSPSFSQQDGYKY